MSKVHSPELKKFMDKRIHLRINGGPQVEGTLCGVDPFMNLVLVHQAGTPEQDQRGGDQG